MTAPRMFTCASCGETFESGWTKEEAMAESRELFGDVPDDELAVVCDTCFRQMESRRKAAGVSLDALRADGKAQGGMDAISAAYAEWEAEVNAAFRALTPDQQRRLDEINAALLRSMPMMVYPSEVEIDAKYRTVME